MRLTPISFYFGGTSTLEKKGTRTVVHMHAVGEKMCATLFVAIDNSGEMMAPFLVFNRASQMEDTLRRRSLSPSQKMPFTAARRRMPGVMKM